MKDHIPLLTSEDGGSLIKKVYPDSGYVRVPLTKAAKLPSLIPTSCKVWIDSGVDGMDDVEMRRVIKRRGPNGMVQSSANPWFTFMSAFAKFEEVATSLAAPAAADINAFVHAILDKCASYKPAWITVPQVPLVDSAERNKVNRLLATAAGKWKSKSSFSGHLVLPLVFTNQRQINGKTARTPKVQQAMRCYHESQADGFWAVDISLCDDSGAGTLSGTRIPGIINLHEELNAKIPSMIRIAGPYWGLNLLLWARGLIDYPLISVGSGYRYYLAGLHPQTGDVRLPLPSLRRRAVADVQLKHWLVEAAKILSSSHPAHAEFSDLATNFTVLIDRDRAKENLARFYKKWFDSIASTPKGGRSMAIFQDLSAAYALGRPLPDIPSDKARRPESVAEALMLNCL